MIVNDCGYLKERERKCVSVNECGCLSFMTSADIDTSGEAIEIEYHRGQSVYYNLYGGRGKGEYFSRCENRKEMGWLITMVENE